MTRTPTDMLTDLLTGLVDSWPNLTQGLVGSALGSGLGVFGAYWVAVRQMRHDRDAQRKAAGGTAAGALLETLLPLRAQLEALHNLVPEQDFDEQGISSWRRNSWREACAAYDVAVVLRGHLLPESVGTALAILGDRLETALEWQWDEVGGLVSCWPSESLTDVLELANAAQRALVNYARAALGDHRNGR